MMADAAELTTALMLSVMLLNWSRSASTKDQRSSSSARYPDIHEDDA